MAKYKKEEALKIILEAAKNYEEKLRGKHFIIFYQENNILAIFKKEYNQKKYSGCTYLAKGCKESDFDLEVI